MDCTFGGGGHSRGILERLDEKGRLIGFDQDADATANLLSDPRFLFIPHNFRHLQRFLRLHGVQGVDGILADLGVSSHQFDEGDRGFSTRFDGPLDMRMDQNGPVKAADVVATYSEQQLHRLFEQYGEVTNARTLARHMVEKRVHHKAETIDSFKQLLAPVVKGNPNKYFAQVFQALRIEVNQELEVLKQLLEQAVAVLNPGGRLAIITFHSLEDRMVKNFFRQGTFEEVADNPFDNTVRQSPLKIITKKPLTASEAELKYNKRSRSAKLRIAEKI